MIKIKNLTESLAKNYNLSVLNLEKQELAPDKVEYSLNESVNTKKLTQKALSKIRKAAWASNAVNIALHFMSDKLDSYDYVAEEEFDLKYHGSVQEIIDELIDIISQAGFKIQQVSNGKIEYEPGRNELYVIHVYQRITDEDSLYDDTIDDVGFNLDYYWYDNFDKYGRELILYAGGPDIENMSVDEFNKVCDEYEEYFNDNIEEFAEACVKVRLKYEQEDFETEFHIYCETVLG